MAVADLMSARHRLQITLPPFEVQASQVPSDPCFTNHVLNDWFGHSADVAETYYLQTTEDDYLEATRPDTQGRGATGGAITRASGAPFRHHTRAKIPKKGPEMAANGSGGQENHTRRDSNPQPSVPKVENSVQSAPKTCRCKCLPGGCLLRLTPTRQLSSTFQILQGFGPFSSVSRTVLVQDPTSGPVNRGSEKSGEISRTSRTRGRSLPNLVVAVSLGHSCLPTPTNWMLHD